MADHPLRPATDRRLGEPLPHQLANQTRADPSANQSFPQRAYPVLAQVSLGYSELKGTFPRVTHPSATHPEGCVRLACVKPAASVRSEPGSNSQVEEFDLDYVTTQIDRVHPSPGFPEAVYSPKHNAGRCSSSNRLRSPAVQKTAARTPPPTLLFLSSLVKEHTPHMTET